MSIVIGYIIVYITHKLYNTLILLSIKLLSTKVIINTGILF